MNIWIEYWRPKTTENKNYHAQSQPIKWEKPDKKDIRKRFCQSKEQAYQISMSLQEQGYHVSVKTDGIL
tara:strand:+ start:1226 stop:1432 length:207 start_codon:yes stop_codon:yes gene_type:complete